LRKETAEVQDAGVPDIIVAQPGIKARSKTGVRRLMDTVLMCVCMYVWR
jgi:hypothetical protein